MERRPAEHEKFYFYNSSFDALELVKKHTLNEQEPTEGWLTNAFGVLINPKYLPEILAGHEGRVEGAPIPANWHSDLAEFGAVFRAIELAPGPKFTMFELGCGWGCWMNISGVVARRAGLECMLYGIEGDEGHVQFAKECLQKNGFGQNQFNVEWGIAAADTGFALFPKQETSGVSWGGEPIFDKNEIDAKKLVATGKYEILPQKSLEIEARHLDRIDLLHIDIQGGELNLITKSMNFLNKKVAYIMVGTHSRQIEGGLFEQFVNHGWTLEIERPAILHVGNNPNVLVDGVQGWRNPRLLSDADLNKVSVKGELVIQAYSSDIVADSTVQLEVLINNQSGSDWKGEGIHPVNLSYHWLNKKGKPIVFDGIRTSLLGTCIRAGETKTQTITVKAPSNPGDYQLQVTMVQEGIQWFESAGFKTSFVPVQVSL
ncbi:hypothetical protein EAW52_11405 [Pseudomonas sp. LTJR-52]|uniref:hypothetical protein n=1 Tax=Pseudomonas sp. LTJR-52 TaxID=2479392 RepID=UPI000EFBB973|nr:hypothetical protein [Pseudomonas sp. LTJR-52]AYN94511.1 hypothetical protein EAW52_11405 [Pseudomonas sp. LTJR-52]